MLGVVTICGVTVDRALLERDQGQPFLFEPPEDVPHQATTDGIGLEQYEGSLGHGRAAYRPDRACPGHHNGPEIAWADAF
jgi:hypothetical protein